MPNACRWPQWLCLLWLRSLLAGCTRELDIQTYLLGDGQTTRLILAQLLDAAEQGVRAHRVRRLMAQLLMA